MQFSHALYMLATAVATTQAAIVDNEGVAHVARTNPILVPATVADKQVDHSSDVRLVARAAPQPFKDNGGRSVVTGGCCNHGVNLRQDICNFNGETGRCIPAASTRNGCTLYVPFPSFLPLPFVSLQMTDSGWAGVGLTCVENSKLTCDPNTLDRGRDKCTLRRGQ